MSDEYLLEESSTRTSDVGDICDEDAEVELEWERSSVDMSSDSEAESSSNKDQMRYGQIFNILAIANTNWSTRRESIPAASSPQAASPPA